LLQQQARNLKIKRSILRVLFVYIPVIVIVAVMLLPFYWMFVTSIKPYPEMFNTKINPFWPQKPTGEHYQELLTKTTFPTYFWNTTVVSVLSTAISLVLSTLAGYSLARLRYRGRSAISSIIFIAYLVPTTLLFIPMAQVVTQLDLINK